MASATFTGNVYDEDGTQIDCKFKAYHYEQDKWSDVRDTEVQQYSIDLADSDWLTNDNSSVNNNEVVLLSFWVGGTTMDGLKDRFVTVKIQLDGSSVYTVDVELRPKTAPYSKATVVSSSTVGNGVVVSDSSGDEYQWDYNGVIHRHSAYYYTSLFSSVGISTIENDFDVDDGYTTDSSYTYQTIGDYTIRHKVTNQYELSSIASYVLRVYYNKPFGYYSYDKSSYILHDDANIVLNMYDIDNRVSSIKEYFDSSLAIDTTDIDGVDYIVTLSEDKVYNHYCDINWNDGFDDNTETVIGRIVLTNVAPTVNVTYSKTGISTYTVDSGAYDHENQLVEVQYKVYVEANSILTENPTSDDWRLIGESIVSSTSKSIVFYKSGKFKVSCAAYDEDGAVSDEGFVVIEASGIGVRQSTYFDWE